MKFLTILLALISVNAFACWKMEGMIDVNGVRVNINQKIDHDKTYTFSSGKHLFHVMIPSSYKGKKNAHMVEMNVEKKDGTIMKQIAQGKVIVLAGNEATMIKHDEKTGDHTIFTVKLTEI